MSRLVVHQFDPDNLQPGGVDTCLSDLIAYAPSGFEFAVVGATASREPLGCWREIEHRGRRVLFMPVARAWRSERRRVPISAKVAAGAIRWRRRLPDATLQVHRIDIAAAVRPLRRDAGYVQFVHNPHGDGASVTGRDSDSFWRFAAPLYARLERSTLQHADRIVVFSAVEARRLASAGFPASAWRTWYDAGVFYPGERANADELRIACVGRLERQKDPLLALEAFAELLRRGVEARVTFLGGGVLRERMIARAKELRLSDVLTIAPATDRRGVAELLRASDVVLLASQYEGSPRIMIESLATGTPVAAAPNADPDGFLRDGSVGSRAEERTPSALADAVLAALDCDPRDCAAAVQHLRADVAVPALIRATSVAPEAFGLSPPLQVGGR